MKSRIANDKLLGSRYKSPTVQVREHSLEVKREREEYLKIRHDLIKEVLFDYPNASIPR
jgi:hypothetical protein